MGIIEEIQDYFLKGIYTFEINNKKAFIVVQTYRAQGKISLFFFNIYFSFSSTQQIYDTFLETILNRIILGIIACSRYFTEQSYELL